MGLHLPPFPGVDVPYKAAVNMRFAGYALIKGMPIDASLLADDERETKLKLLYENHRIAPMTDEEAAENPVLPALTTEQQAEITTLVSGNSRDDLNELAEAADVFEPAKLKDKEAVATAIVRAEAAKA